MSLARVTSILAPFSDFSAVRPEVLAAAAERGTRVHAICVAMLRRLFIPGGIPDECRPYVDSFRLWMPNVADVLLAEAELSCSTYRFCGHPDLIVRLTSGEVVLLDLKTPQAHGKTWRMQLAAYWHLAEAAGFEISRAFTLRLRDHGGRPIVDELRDRRNAWAAFHGALNAHHYLNAA